MYDLTSNLIRSCICISMNKRPQNIASLLALSLVALILSFSVKAAALDAEMSQVTLFVEGMMKSRGGVT